ncbi:kinase-like domain-containing protein [Schizophyllum commune]
MTKEEKNGLTSSSPPISYADAMSRLRANIEKDKARNERQRRSPIYWIGRLFSAASGFMQRLVAMLLYPVGDQLWHLTAGHWLHIKATYRSSSTEAATLRFIKENTAIPVPSVLAHFSWWSVDYLIMTRASGVPLDWVWSKLSDSQRQEIVAQLADVVTQMRALPPPDDNRICSVTGGPIRDSRAYTGPECGPFSDEAHFNLQLRNGRPIEDFAQRFPALPSMHRRRHSIVFTHGDIAPRNIMVKGTRVTALLDWENAGWYPAHWEYCKAYWASWGPDHSSWSAYFSQFIPRFQEEADVDLQLWQETWVPSTRV